MRELFLREKEYEAKLVASRLESARAEVIAEKKAAEIELLRCDQVHDVRVCGFAVLWYTRYCSVVSGAGNLPRVRS